MRLLAVGLVRDSGRRPIAAGAITGPDQVARLLRALLPGDREGFAVIHLDGRHVARSAELVSVGSLNASLVHPREVFKGAILANAAAVILGHNHPSGDPAPSEEDAVITRRLVAVGDLLGIPVLDHVIVAARGVVSFKARGLLSAT